MPCCPCLSHGLSLSKPQVVLVMAQDSSHHREHCPIVAWDCPIQGQVCSTTAQDSPQSQPQTVPVTAQAFPTTAQECHHQSPGCHRHSPASVTKTVKCETLPCYLSTRLHRSPRVKCRLIVKNTFSKVKLQLLRVVKIPSLSCYYFSPRGETLFSKITLSTTLLTVTLSGSMDRPTAARMICHQDSGKLPQFPTRTRSFR